MICQREKNAMRKIAIFLFGALAFAAAGIQSAAAADGCGRGYHYNGYRCVPYGGQYYAGPRYYGEPRYYRQPYYNQGPSIGRNGQVSCGNPNYTFQDGACRPYRGP